MKKLKFLSLFTIMAMLAGCAAETANNSATATLSGTQAVQTGTASASVSANSTSTSEAQSPQTQGQATPAPTPENSAMITPAPTSTSVSTPLTFEAQNGVNNDNIFQIGDYIYYCSGEENPSKGVTYRMNVRTGQSEQFNDVQMLEMTYYGGWIYYVYCSSYVGDALHEEMDNYKFSRIKPDGSQKGPDSNMPHAVTEIFIQDGYLYAVSQIFYHRYYPDDSDKPIRFKLSNEGILGEREALFKDGNIRVRDMAYFNGKIYYNRIEDENGKTQPEDCGLYSCSLDGEAIKRIGDDIEDYRGFFILSDGWLYCSTNNAEDHGDSIYKMRLDGTQKTIIYDKVNLTGNINYMNGKFYFVRYDGEGDLNNNKLCSINSDGTGYSEIAEVVADRYIEIKALTQESIVYSEYLGGLYKIDLDGENKLELSKYSYY